MKTDIRQKIKDGGIITGTHAFIGEPMITEELALAGYDAIWICTEHTAIGKHEVLNNLIACRAGGSNAFVRVAWNDPVLVKPIIDMGPDGIIFPYIRTVEDAKLAVSSCTYPPEGIRGWGPQRAADYGAISQLEYLKNHTRDTMRILQIEHIDAVNCLEEIAEIDGIDGYIVGPNDLSGSVGMLGHAHDREMWPIYDKIGRILSKTGKLFGVSTGFNEAVLNQWLGRGCNCLFTGIDIEHIHNEASRISKGYDEILSKRK